MQKFKVGDRVRVREWDDMAKEFGTIGFGIETPRRFLEEMAELCGETGVIVGIHKKSDGTQELHINWDNDADGNDRKRWNYDNGMFELIVKPITPLRTTPKIVITTDGKTTTAKLYNNKSLCETATAQCSPEDKFDFNIGAKLAMDRLMKAVGGDTDAKTDCGVINVGDRVHIIDDGGVYPTYDSWISENAPQYAIYYAFGADLPTDQFKKTYYVLKKAPHRDTGKMLCLISTNGVPVSCDGLMDSCGYRYEPCYLINESDLAKVTQ